MASNYKIRFNVDMAFCIDVTGSMDNIIEIVKNNALNLYQDVKNCIEKKEKYVDTLRVRIIAYRDYLADGADAMQVTNFFTLPQEADSLRKCVGSLVAKGGGDDPEDGFEALGYAIKSKWNKEPGKKRHVIVLWTDDDAHDLGHGKSSEYYPNGMAADFGELTDWWGYKAEPGLMDQDAKRLILFAPNMEGWKKVSGKGNWDKVLHYHSDVGNGLRDVDYNKILSAICETI